MARERNPHFGAWLKQQRAARQWTQDVLREELTRLTGVRVTRNWISQLENGDEPSEELQQAFERLLGRYDVPHPVSPTVDLSGVLAAMRDQTEAVTRLADARQDRDLLAAAVHAAVAPFAAEAREAREYAQRLERIVLQLEQQIADIRRSLEGGTEPDSTPVEAVPSARTEAPPQRVAGAAR